MGGRSAKFGVGVDWWGVASASRSARFVVVVFKACMLELGGIDLLVHLPHLVWQY